MTENDTYIVRTPESAAEEEEQDKLLIAGKLDNPYYILYGITEKGLEELNSHMREWELSHRQRLCIYHKPTGKLCAAMVVLRMSEEKALSESDV